MKYTNEQAAIFDCIENTENHLIVNAGAGTGKTTTIVEAANKIGDKKAAFLAFNKSILVSLFKVGWSSKALKYDAISVAYFVLVNNSSIVDQPTSTDTTATGGSDWLQDAYTAAGLGTVDAGGREYWEKDLGKGQTQGQIIANILRHS